MTALAIMSTILPMNASSNATTVIGPFSLQTFTLAVALAVMAAAGVGLRRAADRRGAWADAYLVALALGAIGARVGHVLLNWEHFAYNTADIWRLAAGGLDWHGAVTGGLIGLIIGARWRSLSGAELLDSLTMALPLIALAGWWGCWAAHCGYGAEVDTLANHPPFAVSEGPDVYGILAPRYNTQIFGLLLALVTLLIASALVRLRWMRYRRFGLILAFLSVGMFTIGFVRGDYAAIIGGLRADQWLDLGTLLLGLMLFFRVSSPKGALI